VLDQLGLARQRRLGAFARTWHRHSMGAGGRVGKRISWPPARASVPPGLDPRTPPPGA
jgi:hypothetical protein